jgi:hypothetical protein
MTIRYTHGSRELYKLYHVLLDVRVEGRALCGVKLGEWAIEPNQPPFMRLCSFCEQQLLEAGITPKGATLPWPPLLPAQRSSLRMRSSSKATR